MALIAKPQGKVRWKLDSLEVNDRHVGLMQLLMQMLILILILIRVCLKIWYIPNEIAIYFRDNWDNDQQNHWL